MEKITVIFGGPVELYRSYFKIFDAIEKEFNTVIRRVSPRRFRGNINNTIIDFRLCLNPIRDKLYYLTKKYNETEWKDVVPVPAEEIVKNIKDTDIVLFFGLCGVFNGKKNQLFIPDEFKEIFFKERRIKYKHILEIKPKNKIKIKNILKGKINGKNAGVITSNITLAPKTIENESKEHLIEMAGILSKYGDIVDKEAYQIAKYFKGKKPLGMGLVSSDVLTIKRQMLIEGSFNPKKDIFNKMCIDSLKYFV